MKLPSDRELAEFKENYPSLYKGIRIFAILLIITVALSIIYALSLYIVQ